MALMGDALADINPIILSYGEAKITGVTALTTFLEHSGAFTRPGVLTAGPGPPSLENEPLLALLLSVT
jgi:hypothetical protein